MSEIITPGYKKFYHGSSSICSTSPPNTLYTVFSIAGCSIPSLK